MQAEKLKDIVQALVLASSEPLSVEKILQCFDDYERPSVQELKAVLAQLSDEPWGGFEFKYVSSGYRYQIRQQFSPWVSKLFAERPPRLSRAYLETLAIIAYRQPVTRADIEDVRGVAVSSNIIKSLLEREWIRIVGHKDVPGKPAILATTKQFLDYFNLSSLEQLPTLQEVKDIDQLLLKLNDNDESLESQITLETQSTSEESEDCPL